MLVCFCISTISVFVYSFVVYSKLRYDSACSIFLSSKDDIGYAGSSALYEFMIFFNFSKEKSVEFW